MLKLFDFIDSPKRSATQQLQECNEVPIFWGGFYGYRKSKTNKQNRLNQYTMFWFVSDKTKFAKSLLDYRPVKSSL